jgi:hypothetical protein
LLELLVVVAILAAVAGTATIVLQDTDRRASAAAHVAMMDELKKGVMTFSVLRQGLLPDNYDSLLQSSDGTAANATALMSRLAESTAGMLEVRALPTGAGGTNGTLAGMGITQMRLINLAAEPVGAGAVTTCANLQTLVNDKSGGTVINNIYNAVSASGCGVSYALAASVNVAMWVGGQRRVLGAAEPELGATTPTADNAAVATAIPAAPTVKGQRMLMAVGFGPSTTLFDGKIGALSTVPAYRHTAPDEYNRFIGLFEIADSAESDTPGTFDTWQAVPPQLVAVIDGAGDTKEEEIGEFDGTRSTI